MSTGERPFRAINKHVNPVLGWSWLAASLAANMVWSLPQYAICFSVVEQNLWPEMFVEGAPLAGDVGKWAVSGGVLLISVIITWSYGSGHWGVKLYEWMLKLVVGLIVLCFVGVVFKLSTTGEGLDWGAILAGFVPNINHLFHPAETFQPLLDAIGDPTAKVYWTNHLVSQQRDVMIGATAAAVGINMTFLLPYSMIGRGWGKEFRTLSIFDLSTGMFIPFLLATSCVIIASANQFHAQPVLGLVTEAVDSQGEIIQPAKGHVGAYRGTLAKRMKDLWTEQEKNDFKQATKGLDKEQIAAELDKRLDAFLPSIDLAEKTLAASLVKRDAMQLSNSLTELTGRTVANLVFGLGVVAMTMSSISLMMLISGFILCEVFDVPPTGWTHRLGCLISGVFGALWPLFWTGGAKFWLTVVASVFGAMLLPIAYWTFYLLMNQRSLLKSEMPTGMRRVAWNVLMAIAGLSATGASMY
ncbi:MAG: divalent metal cation transporter, partial [Planctomycetales bacterium]